MASASGLRHVSIGQYVPLDSPVHRMDPRAKMLVALAIVAGVVVLTDYVGNLLLLAIAFGFTRLARLSVRRALAPIVPAVPIILVLSLFQLLFYRDPTGLEPVLVRWGWIQISTANIRIVVVAWMRLIDLILLTSAITSSTTVGAITYALEWFLAPLRRVGLPGHELAMVGAIAMRFLPILGEQAESILQAQDSRGVGSEDRARWQLMSNARRMGRLMIPLFVDAFRRSEEMVLAMQARCYRGGVGRTHLVDYQMHARDGVLVMLSVVLVSLAWWIQAAGWP